MGIFEIASETILVEPRGFAENMIKYIFSSFSLSVRFTLAVSAPTLTTEDQARICSAF